MRTLAAAEVDPAASGLDRLRADEGAHAVHAELGQPLIALSRAERLAVDEHILVLDGDLGLGLGHGRGDQQREEGDDDQCGASLEHVSLRYWVCRKAPGHGPSPPPAASACSVECATQPPGTGRPCSNDSTRPKS